MDNLQPPEELQHLWLERGPEKEDAGAVVTHVLRDARKHQRRARTADLAVIVAYVIFLPVMLLMTLAFLGTSPLVAAGCIVWVMLLLAGLVAYRIYYRSMREEPAPGTTSREYVEYSIEHLNRRERFLVKSATPLSALESLAGILFAFAAVQGQEVDLALVYVVLCFLAQPANLWWTLHAQRKYSTKRSRLRQILADLDA